MPTFLKPLCAVTVLVCALGCESTPQAVYHKGLTEERFTRCNLRTSRTTLYSANFLADASALPLGTPARVTMFSSEEVRVSILGVVYKLYPVGSEPFGTSPQEITTFLNKYFVAAESQLNLDSLGPTEFTEKVRTGEHAVGMTKEQVYACVGPPLYVEEKELATNLPYGKIIGSDHWVYPYRKLLTKNTHTTVEFFFGGDGKLIAAR